MSILFFASACICIWVIYITSTRIQKRWILSKAKHPSLRGHSKWSRRIAKKIPFFHYDHKQFFSSDGAPSAISAKREKALDILQKQTSLQNSQSLKHFNLLENSVSDVRFTSNYRVPFPYRTILPEVFKSGVLVTETKGVKIKDIDGNWRYDLSGSYGVNVFGYDFYKACMQEGSELVKELGPVLGSYHPLLNENVDFIKRVSGLNEVSFHMSGTEAVMQAVRLARYHTQKSYLVRFCGAYHGWWDGVQPGVGNNRKVNDVYTLADMSDKTIKVLETRTDIACLLINPLQAFHPNADASSDATLIASDRSTHFDKKTYTEWLKQLRDICTRRGIVLIFDEVFVGFRLGMKGAQEYFNVQADLVTYGKTLGGGLPVGVLAGRHDLMKRFKDNKPVDVSFARGTFNSHPSVIATMNAFIKRIQTAEVSRLYEQAEALWDQRVELFNRKLAAANLPLKLSNMHSILTLHYTQPSRYNWMLQFYLRQAGIELSWVGTGRFIMSFNFTDAEFEQVIQCFIDAATRMQNDAWWWSAPKLTNKAIKRQFLCDMLASKYPILARRIIIPLLTRHCKNNNSKLFPLTNTQINKVG